MCVCVYEQLMIDEFGNGMTDSKPLAEIKQSNVRLKVKYIYVYYLLYHLIIIVFIYFYMVKQ